MPGKLKVRIHAARDLPIMDRASELTDAFVEVKFGSTTYKTDVCRKSLHPQWNTEWYKFEVDDEDLQDEPLQIKVLDHDTYSAHDAIGKVYIDLNPMLTKERTVIISGWFPIFDTMHGIRGEINVSVKVDLFSDFNKFRQSSCGVQFLCSTVLPQGYHLRAVHGFVEELVVNDDPEYQWIDKIRSMRSSNEARQVQFSKLSGELQRKIGLKVLEMGGNAVTGYRQCFDIEGESGIVVRAIGTAVTLSQLHVAMTPPISRDFGDEGVAVAPGSPVNMTPTYLSSSPSKAQSGGLAMIRRSSDSDIGTPPRGSVGGGSSGSGGFSGSGGIKAPFHRPILQQENIEMLEYPFFTMKTFPPGFLMHLGGVVSARSVKLLTRIHNPDEPETRDAWWTELRIEVRSHTRALGCHAVIGYVEHTTICEDIIILSAYDRGQFEREREGSAEKATPDRLLPGKLHIDVNLANETATRNRATYDGKDDWALYQCSLCHIPYKEASLPFPVSLQKCCVCRRNKVPDVLFTTIEPPPEVPIIGKGCLVQARICRAKKDAKGETNAKEVSDCLPFMEYELHSVLLNKLKMKGMNTLFGVKIQFTVGEELIVAIATATAALCAPIPAPQPPKITAKPSSEVRSSLRQDLQRKILETFNRNKDIYNLHVPEFLLAEHSPHAADDKADLENDLVGDLDLTTSNKDTFVLEIDDAEDLDVVAGLLDPPVPEGFEVCSTEKLPGGPCLVKNLQMFTKVWRGELNSVCSKGFSDVCDNLLKGVFFRLRTMVPCVICNINFDVDLPEEDEIQVSVTGMCVGIGEGTTPAITAGLFADTEAKRAPARLNQSGDQDDMQFHMEMAHDPSSQPMSVQGQPMTVQGHAQSGLRRASSVSSHSSNQSSTRGSQSRLTALHKKLKYHSPVTQQHGVVLTSLAYVPNARIESYLGHLNFFIIRESTSVKEEGGLNGFMHSFLAEVKAICRAHVAALGGNALVAYHMTECVLEDNLHKNQSQCLANVYGDVVQVFYGPLEMPLDATMSSVSSTRVSSVSPSVESLRPQTEVTEKSTRISPLSKQTTTISH